LVAEAEEAVMEHCIQGAAVAHLMQDTRVVLVEHRAAAAVQAVAVVAVAPQLSGLTVLLE
jgi:hypothetical protein